MRKPTFCIREHKSVDLCNYCAADQPLSYRHIEYSTIPLPIQLVLTLLVPYFAEAGKSLEESAREYQATHGKKTELQEVEIVTGEEDESNVLQVILAHQIGKPDVLPWVRYSYITDVISPKTHVLILNIGHIGRHVTLSLSGVTTTLK